MLRHVLDLVIGCSQDREWIVTLYGQGRLLGSHTCSFRSYRICHSLVDGVRQLLKAGGNAAVAAPLLHSVGTELFCLWLAPLWSEITDLLAGRGRILLTVVADLPELLNLPWELLCWPDGVILGLDQRFVLRRRPSRYLDRVCSVLPADSQDAIVVDELRIASMVSTPVGFKGEEGGEVGRVLSEHGAKYHPGRFSMVMVPTATCAALRRSIQEFRPNLLYLSGPTFIRGEQGFFACTDEDGQADIVSATELAAVIASSSDIVAVIVAGREWAAPPPVAAVGAVCQAFVCDGVGLALAWPSRVEDPFSGVFLDTFLREMGSGVDLDQSIQRARRVVQRDSDVVGYPAWVLPTLYSCSGGTFRVNIGRIRSDNTVHFTVSPVPTF